MTTPERLRAWAACWAAAVPCPRAASLPLPPPPVRRAVCKPPSQCSRGRLHPTGRDPGSNPRRGGPPPPNERILDTCLRLSFIGVANGVANLFFLVMVRLVAVMTAENHGTGQLRVPELPVRPFSAGNQQESRPLQICNELANLAWHTHESATTGRRLPMSLSPNSSCAKRFTCRRLLARTAACSRLTHTCQDE